MSTKAGKKLLEGLEDVLDHVEGGDTRVVLHAFEVPEVDTKKVRTRTGLSQEKFAKLINVPVGTLRNWEQGHRHPTGPAKTLMAVLDKRPTIVQELFSEKV